MKARLLHSLRTIYTSYWLLPAVLVVGAFALAQILLRLDHAGILKALSGTGWLATNNADGARDVLSTIASSTISVAGVAFSITILSVANAASQMGPSLLRNFMRDRGSQTTLGVLLGTFIYCLAVLRNVQGGDHAFVPHIALFGALVLTSVCIAVLIYFFHHVPERLNIANLVREVGIDLSRCAPSETSSSKGFEDSSPARAESATTRRDLLSPTSGYLVGHDSNEYVRVLQQHKARLEFLKRPGDFVLRGEAYACLTISDTSPQPDADGESVDDALRALVVLAGQRFEVEDPRFMVNQLVEVAARALSPGVNAPLTAVLCIDAMFGALERWGAPVVPSNPDSPESICSSPPLTFADLLDQGCDALRSYGAGDYLLASHMMRGLEALESTVAARWRPAIRAQREQLYRSGLARMTDEEDRRAWQRSPETSKPEL